MQLQGLSEARRRHQSEIKQRSAEPRLLSRAVSMIET
jgi:hypothetical protein